MRLSFREHTIELQSWESELAMMNYLKRANAGSVVLGMDVDKKVKFYSVLISLEWATESSRHYAIGICSEGHGLVPHLLLQPLAGQLVLGFNSEVVGFNVHEKKLIFRIKLDTLFSSCISIENLRRILIIHEAGLVCISENGQIVWKYDSDVITDCRVAKETIQLKFMDSEKPVILNLLNGKEVA